MPPPTGSSRQELLQQFFFRPSNVIGFWFVEINMNIKGEECDKDEDYDHVGFDDDDDDDDDDGDDDVDDRRTWWWWCWWFR